MNAGERIIFIFEALNFVFVGKRMTQILKALLKI